MSRSWCVGENEEYETESESENMLEEQDAKPIGNAMLALKPNTYDAAVLAMTKLNDPETVRTNGAIKLWISVIIATSAHVVAVLLQVLLIFMLLQFTIERSEDKFEIDLAAETKSLMAAITAGEALNNVTSAKVLNMCKDDHNIPYSQSVMTWLWGMKLLPIIVQGMWSLRVLSQTPVPKAGESLLTHENDKVTITRFPTGLKWISVFLVQMPRILVPVYLYCMGAKFLMYAPSLGFLIMKSVGLAFISTIPDILSQGLFSEAFHKELGKAQFSFRSVPNENWDLWGASLTKLVIVLSVTLFYCRIVCGDLQALRAACTEYEYHFVLPGCAPHCGSHMLGFTFYN